MSTAIPSPAVDAVVQRLTTMLAKSRTGTVRGAGERDVLHSAAERLRALGLRVQLAPLRPRDGGGWQIAVSAAEASS